MVLDARAKRNGRDLLASVTFSYLQWGWRWASLGHFAFLSDPGKPGVRSLGPDVRPSVSLTPCWNLTDVTLANEDTNSIPTDNANRAIQGNVAMHWCNLVANFRTNASGATSCPNFEPMQVVPIYNSMQVAKFGKWCHLVAKFSTNASGAIWWPNLELMQVVPFGGQICN